MSEQANRLVNCCACRASGERHEFYWDKTTDRYACVNSDACIARQQATPADIPESVWIRESKVASDCYELSIQPFKGGVEHIPRATADKRVEEAWEAALKLAKKRIGVLTNSLSHLTATDVDFIWDDLDEAFAAAKKSSHET